MGSQGPVGPLDPWALWTWPLDPVPFGPKCPRIPSFSTIFSVARVVEKSTLLGTQSVDSLTLSGVQAKSLFNKDCLQSFPGPPGRPKEPTRGPTFSQRNLKKTLSPRKVDPLGGSICRLPAPLGSSGRSFVEQRLTPELPGAPGPPGELI